jgi:hypothetical protein
MHIFIDENSLGLTDPVGRIAVTGVARALMETSPHPVGDYKCYWTMKLKLSGLRQQLPRGFVKSKKPVYVGGPSGIEAQIGRQMLAEIADAVRHIKR